MNSSASMAMTSSKEAGGLPRSSTSSSRAASFSAGPNHVSSSTVTSTPLGPVTVKIEAAKRLAAYAAVDAFVKPEHKVIGIGSGTTVPYVVERIIQQGHDLNVDASVPFRLKLVNVLAHVARATLHSTSWPKSSGSSVGLTKANFGTSL